jgi:hypothetical protein
MKRLLKKLLVVIVLFAPLFINTDCKKQKRCGCPPRGDELYELTKRPSYVFFDKDNPIITMQTYDDYYSYYTFCNPDEIMPKLKNFKSGDELNVSGQVFWDCNYVMQANNQSYSTYSYRSYNIYVTDIYMNMYGKDDSDETLKRAQ